MKRDMEMREPTGTRSAQGQIEVDATPGSVWKALTEARELERWFPLDARVDAGEGGTIWMSWRNEFANSLRILVWDPPQHLRTEWSFHEGESPGQVTDYIIDGRGGKTVVRAVTSGFPLDEAWDGWVEGTNRGWAFELGSLKHYLEHHRGKDRHVAYRRWRAPLTAGDAWDRLARDNLAGRWLATGKPFDNVAARQYAAVVDDAHKSLLRVSVEPAAPGGVNEIVFWLSAWGDGARQAEEAAAEWAETFPRLFPEGSAP